MRTTKFHALRNFRFAGRDCRLGEILELDDDQAAELVALGDTVEPVEARDRKRVHVIPSLQWETPAQAEERLGTAKAAMRLAGSFGR